MEEIIVEKNIKIRKRIEAFFENYSKLESKQYFNSLYGLKRDIRKEDLYNKNSIVKATEAAKKKGNTENYKIYFPFAEEGIRLGVPFNTFFKYDSSIKFLKNCNINSSEYFLKNKIKVDFSNIKLRQKSKDVYVDGIKINGREASYSLPTLIKRIKNNEFKPTLFQNPLAKENEQKEKILRFAGNGQAELQNLNPGVLKFNNKDSKSYFEVRKSGKGGGSFDDTSTAGIDMTIRIPSNNGEEVLLLNLKNRKRISNEVKKEIISFFKVKGKNVRSFAILNEDLPEMKTLSIDKTKNESILSFGKERFIYKGYDKFWWNKRESLKLTFDRYFIEQILEPLSETVGIHMNETKNDFAPSNSFKVIHVNSSVSTEDWNKCLNDIIKVYNRMKSLGMYTGKVGVILSRIKFNKLGKIAASVETYFPY